MKQQRLLNLSVVFLIPLALLAVLLAAADLAGPAPNHSPVESLPTDTSNSPSIIARRAISIPYLADNSALPSPAGEQIAARQVISIPYFIDNFELPSLAGEQIAARRVISIPYFVDNSTMPALAGDLAM